MAYRSKTQSLDTYPVDSTGRPQPLDSDAVLEWLDDANDEAQDWYFTFLLGNRWNGRHYLNLR